MGIPPVVTRGLVNTATRMADWGPAAYRGAIGAGALALQPGIDYYMSQKQAQAEGKDGSERAKYSATRTAIKAVVCAIGGMASREIGDRGAQFLVDALKLNPSEAFKKTIASNQAKKLAQLGLKAGKELTDDVYKAAYKKNIGMWAGNIVAVASIFVETALVNKVLNFTMDKLFKDKPFINKELPDKLSDIAPLQPGVKYDG